MNYKNILKRQTFVIVISVICLTIGVIGGSFALFFSISDDTNNQIVKAGELSINFGKNGSTIMTEELVPMSDKDGMAQIGTNFAITNEGSLPGLYYIAVYNNTTGITNLSSLLNHDYIRISIDNKTPRTLSEVKHTDDTLSKTNQNEIHYELLKGTIEASKNSADNANIETHNIKIWINEEAPTDIIGKLVKLQIEVVSVVDRGTYADTSGAEEPELNNGLIPVTWNGSNWVKADTASKWYDYDAQWWANAVTVSASTRSKYTSAAVNTTIDMNDIETMWVWVPRYEYQHTNLSTQYAGGTKALPGGITINFISKETTTPSSDNYTIHDAFWWDNNNDGIKDANEQLSGIWVAKFKMSTGNTTCTPATNAVETGCDITTITPQIKPNVISWRGARIGTLWTVVHEKMNGSSNSYGLINSDTHLMKNMEWGAVAYLSQSKYGKYGNANYTGANKEIYQNKSTEYLTGSSNGTPSSSTANTQIAYNIEDTGTGASTTGNIYGIYDMSGGATEYVMGIMKESSNTEPAIGNTIDSNSGWSGKLYNGTNYTGTYGQLKEIGSKYYDLYDYNTSSTVTETRAHKGDATFETEQWYSDYAYFVNNGNALFIRGGSQSNNANAGVFHFSGYDGFAHVTFSGRPVLVQTYR